MRLHACLCLYVCVCIRVYVCVHTSHLHGAMPHRFHWGVWEQRLSISSAAVPAGKSLIIISWMMSLRHAPHSRPVAASLQHPSLSFSLFVPFSLLLPLLLFLEIFFLFIIFHMRRTLLIIRLLLCSLRPTLTPPLSLCLYHSFTSFNSKELNEDIHSVFLSFPLSATLTQSLFKIFYLPFPL